MIILISYERIFSHNKLRFPDVGRLEIFLKYFKLNYKCNLIIISQHKNFTLPSVDKPTDVGRLGLIHNPRRPTSGKE
ncbi:MAG: hypothetical protein WCS86_01755 [Candidatus Paceibacterota bacterium]